MKALSRAARAEANRGMSRDNSRQSDDVQDDNSNNIGDNSPNLSQQSDDTDEMQAINQSGLVYGAAVSKGDQIEAGHSSNQPEVHIVQIRDLEEGNLQHSQTTWSKTESDIWCFKPINIDFLLQLNLSQTTEFILIFDTFRHWKLCQW